MIRNVAFVAREYQTDCDDEIVDGHDGLFDEFGGDSYCITRNAFFLGLTRDSGVELLTRPDEVGDDKDDLADDDNETLEDEDADVRVAEAVAEALELQEFFQLRKEQEELKAEHEAAMRAADEALDQAIEEMELARELYPEDYDDPVETEVEVVEKATPIRRHYSSPGYNHKGRPRKKIDCKTYRVVRTYVSQGQRCYGGQDNRRLRRNDDTGKVIGHNHRRRRYDHDSGKIEFHPVAVILDDGTALRVS